jgi:uncharacterized protein YdaU (DUF1376 family)
MAKEQAPAFQFYPRDFIADGDQAAMSLEQVGAYIRMLSYAWLKVGLPDDVDKIARMIRGEVATVSEVLAEHFQRVEGPLGVRFVNPRQEEERRKQAKFRRQQQLKGRASANRRATAVQPEGNHGSTAVQPEGNSSSSSASASSEEREKEHRSPALNFVKAKPLTVEECFGPSDDALDPAAEHVAAVMAAWSEEYSACRGGAIFRPHPIRDYAVFKELADTYAAVPHLRQMFRFFFLATDLPDWAASRSPRSFLRLAPETDAAVRRTA